MSEKIESASVADQGGNAAPDPPNTIEPNTIGQVGAQVREAGGLAKDIAEEARSRGASLAGDVKDQVLSTVDAQREGLAGQVSGVAESIHQAGEHFKGNQDWIANVMERGGDELATLAATLRENDLEGLMGKLRDLARSQPAIFVGAAMAAGFAAARIGKVAASGASKADLPSLPEARREPE